LKGEIELDSPQPFTAQYLAFYYPGWQASIDGQPVETTPSIPHGLITFPVPAGKHAIRIRFGPTGLRRAAALASFLALAAIGIVALVIHRYQNRSSGPRPPSGWPLGGASYAFFLGAAVLLLGLRILIDQENTPLRHSRLSSSPESGLDLRLQGVEQPAHVDFGGRWTLLGHDRLPDSVESGGTLEVVLYWRALAPEGQDYAASLALVDGSGQRWTQVGMRSPRWHRTPPPVHTWPIDSYGMTAYLADVLPGTPPGDYQLILTSFDKADPLQPLTAFDRDGNALGPSMTLGAVRVDRPSSPPQADQILVQHRLDNQLGPLTLAGVTLDRSQAAPGDPMQITLLWQVADQAVLPDLMAHLALFNAQAEQVAEWELPPVRADWPTNLWRHGDLWRAQHGLRLPGGLESGDYTWRLYLYEAADSDAVFPPRDVPLGQVRVDAPVRQWEPPPLQLPMGKELGEKVTLLGANLTPEAAGAQPVRPPTTLTVELVWRAQTEMENSYRVFLHLLQPDGNLLTQSDGEPAGWTRPTTGWAPGEVIIDERVLEIPVDAPPGEYRLITGLYDPGTWDRLTLADGATTIQIGTLRIEQP
jgi:hypothetical protein